MKRAMAVLMALAALAVWTAAGCKDKDNRGGSSGGGNQIEDKLPQEPALAVVDSTTGQVGPQGGTVKLSDGAAVEFPPNAIANTMDFKVEKLDVSPRFPSKEGYAVGIRCTSPVSEFKQDVTIRVPVPESAGKVAHCFASMLDDQTGGLVFEPGVLKVANGRTEMVLATRHFSEHYFEACGPLPDKSEPFEVPYYTQGDTPFCWATCSQMFTRAAHPGDAAIHGFIGTMKVGTEGFTPPLATGSAYKGLLTKRATQTPALGLWNATLLNAFNWGDLSMTNLKDYCRNKLRNRHPVLINSKQIKHAVLLVGYDKDTYITHDPRETGLPDNRGYKKMTAAEVGLGSVTPFVDATATAVFLDPVAPNRPLVTINLPDRGAWFVATKESRDYVYQWDWNVDRGYSFFFQKAGKGSQASVTIPPECGSLMLGRPPTESDTSPRGGLEIINSHLAGEATVSVQATLLDADGKAVWQETKGGITLPARTRKEVYFNTSVANFRPKLGEQAKDFKVIAAVLEGGKIVDQTGFDFTLEPSTDPPDTKPSVVLEPHNATGLPNQDVQISAVVRNAPAGAKFRWGVPSKQRSFDTADPSFAVKWELAGEYAINVQMYDKDGKYLAGDQGTVTISVGDNLVWKRIYGKDGKKVVSEWQVIAGTEIRQGESNVYDLYYDSKGEKGTGKVTAHSVYVHGTCTESTRYYPSGQKQAEEHCDPATGKRYGVWRTWTEKGTLVSETEYANGEKDGADRRWEPETGRLLSQGHYKAGSPCGEFQEYFPPVGGNQGLIKHEYTAEPLPHGYKTIGTDREYLIWPSGKHGVFRETTYGPGGGVETTYGENGKVVQVIEYHNGYTLIRHYDSAGNFTREDRVVTATTSPAGRN